MAVFEIKVPGIPSQPSFALLSRRLRVRVVCRTLPASWLPTVGGASCNVANSVVEISESHVVAPRQRVSEKVTGSLSLFLVFFTTWHADG